MLFSAVFYDVLKFFNLRFQFGGLACIVFIVYAVIIVFLRRKFCF
jgi:hypothetical protein